MLSLITFLTFVYYYQTIKFFLLFSLILCCKFFFRTITEEDWLSYSQNNIDAAVKELVAGRPLRSYIDLLLSQVIEDLWKQYNIVNEGFRQRIEEYKESKGKMEKQHFDVSYYFYSLL